MDAGVNPTLQEACGLFATNRTRQLLCYEGKELSNYEGQTVPYSIDYCALEVFVKGGGQKGFFDCIFQKAKLPKEKQYCDMFYSYGGNATNSTYGLKVLNKRYDCYKEYLGISKDRQYCDLSESEESKFYVCLEKHDVNDKPDYCIWREK